MNKHIAVLNYLKEHKSITSWEAIEHFGATRLSAIIFNLKKKNYDIQTIMMEDTDRYGNTCRYAKYILKGEN